MRLKTVKLKNFRGYKDEVVISINDLTAFIGKNDVGKSTIMEALEIFFNGDSKTSLVKCEPSDLCIYSRDSIIEITCVFDDLPESIVIDSTASTSLKEEFLLNEDGDLEIKKKYDCSLKTPKASVSFVCMQPDDPELAGLFSKNNAELKALADSLNIDKKEYRANANTELRSAIRKAKGLALTNTVKTEVVAQGYLDKIWKNIQSYIPMYALFQSDRTSSDSDREIIDPMKIAVQHALKNVEEQLNNIKDQVRKEALDTANRTLEKLKEMSPDMAEALIPEFSAEPKFDSIFKLSINSDNNIPMNKRGSGVRRLLLLNFFRAEAERKMSESNHSSVIYAFEEPETSQHPDFQVMLIEAFRELSRKKNVQILLTTHNPALAGMIDTDDLRFIKKTSDSREILPGIDPETNNVKDTEKNSVYDEICEELGMLPTPIQKDVKALLLVEGHGDTVFVNHIAEQYYENGFLSSTFEKKKMAIIPVGGCGTLKHWIELKLIDQFHIPWCIMLDSDIGASEDTNNRSKAAVLRTQGIKAYTTRKREPENYIDPESFREDCSEAVIYTATDDAKQIISKATKTRPNFVLTKYWPKMTYEQIKNSDKYEENGVEHHEFREMFEDFFTLC